MNFRKLLILSCLSLTIGTGNLRAQNMLDAIAAVVNDEIILNSEVLLVVRNEVMKSRVDFQNRPELLDSLYSVALGSLIDQKVIFAKAIEDSIAVTDEEINQQVDFRLTNLESQFGSRAAVESQYNASYTKIKDIFFRQFKEQFLIRRLRQQIVADLTVSRAEVEDYYNKNKDNPDFGSRIEDAYQLGHILFYMGPTGATFKRKLAVLEQINDRIVAGEDFDQLAEEFKNDRATGISSSDVGVMKLGELNKNFENAAVALDSGAVSGIVVTDLDPAKTWGYHIIKNLGTSPGTFHPKHIFFAHTIDGEDEKAVADSLAAVRNMALQGTEFGELAGKYSQDEQTNTNGGLLPEKFSLNHRFFSDFPEFKTAALKLDAGEISEPFRTRFGYHIVKVVSIDKGRERELESDWDYFSQQALNAKHQQFFFEWLQNAKGDVYIDIKK